MSNPQDELSGKDMYEDRLSRIRRINLQLAAMGQPTCQGFDDNEILDVADDLLRLYRQQKRLLSDYLCPIDQRIQDYLDTYFKEHGIQSCSRLPSSSFILDRPGLARELSLPVAGNEFKSELLESYRTQQGVLHNPSNDRRTTQGAFHIVEGGLPIPDDKLAVPVSVFSKLLEAALQPPNEIGRLPFTGREKRQAKVWVSLHMRPKVYPGIAGISQPKTMETRFFAPGGLVSNLDFVESIFGNAGDPYLPRNDAALDIFHWCGTTGCVILAPHLVGLSKKELGLPHITKATDRQRRDGMCWQDAEERYNSGSAFKVVCRDIRGTIVTLIADNYFGYSKKEIKSQISYSTNIMGDCEEEHAGGALVFPGNDLGDAFQVDGRIRNGGHTFKEVVARYGDSMTLFSDGYAKDKRFSNIIYVPEDVRIELNRQKVSWTKDNIRREQKLLAGHTYIHPSGYKIRLEKDQNTNNWRLVGIDPEGTLCHKPCTVSGGGKSEISKSLSSAVLSGAVYVKDIVEDLNQVDEILRKDYSNIYRESRLGMLDVRSLLSPLRSLGSVVRLLTASITEYTDEYNSWLYAVPQHIRALVFLVKRFYDPDWGEAWQQYFSVDVVNGYGSNELRYSGKKLIASYLRVGFDNEGAWRVFKLRQDFSPSDKIQMEDDITVSTTIPSKLLENNNPEYRNYAVKLLDNCEALLFQRPDEAVIRGVDVQTENDFSRKDNFISNYQPLMPEHAKELLEDAMGLDRFTPPMRKVIRNASELNAGEYFVSSAHPRLVNGKPTTNVRYLQRRADLENPREKYIAEVGIRLHRRIPVDKEVYFTVNAVLPGRRNNPPDYQAGIRPLSVYNPIHYQELPELFMDYICSLTGKSPSTTGAGSEGALTKGPFNALSGTADLNTALVSSILSGYNGFTTAAGYIGTDRRIDHDISLLMPEIWARLSVQERDPYWMLDRGYLEKMEDFEFEGEKIAAGRLGYRITDRFVHAFLGKIFDNPNTVFDQAMLKPELQGLDVFVDGLNNITEAQRVVAKAYIEDATVEDACPPLRALLYIMAEGSYQGMDERDPRFRSMFTLDYLLESDWYQERLRIKQRREIELWLNHVDYLECTVAGQVDNPNTEPMDLEQRLNQARKELRRVSSPVYREGLEGSLGADWISKKVMSSSANHLVSITPPSIDTSAA